MYRITPLDDNLPSPYELLFNRKPRSFIPGCQRTTKSRHPENDQHIEQNQRRQEDQARFYNEKATHDRKSFQPGEPVNIYNTTNKEWEPGTVVRQDQQEAEPRTYTVHKGNKEYRGTRRTSEDTKTFSQSCYKHIDESRNHQPVTNGQPAGAKR